MNKYFLLIGFFIVSVSLYAQVPTPAEFLGYELGEEFTPHHRVVDYYKLVAENLPTVKLQEYGTTYEGRPLMIAYISSEENMARLEEVRLNNLRLAGLADSEELTDAPAIVWLSYNVHGNESSSTEASLKTLYFLADPTNAKSAEWLKNTVVIMDPCVNPDGRERYVNFYRQYKHSPLVINPNAMSHQEDWPGGRMNHYLFDLNRDWLWLTQKESQQRLALYNEWLPQIHVDFHEQSRNSPYYFAPGAEPYHSIITPWQRNFQKEIGQNHASYFDKNNWVYFTSEYFDLLYPSYGDTYPTFSGAIGMTYEQAGGGAAGLAVKTNYEDTLTLSDRLEHHFTTGISTVEITSKNAARLLGEFDKYFSDNPGGTYKSFIVDGTNNKDKIRKLVRLLDKHKIRYGSSSFSKSLNVFNYQNAGSESIKMSKDHLVISVDQPKGRLVSALFEPQTFVADSLTYDITAWSLPYAMGIRSYATSTVVLVDGTFTLPEEEFTTPPSPPYAYLLRYESVDDGIFLGALLQSGIQVGVLNKPATFGAQTFDRGSLVILRGNNMGRKNFDSVIQTLASTHKRNPLPVNTGLATSGIDLGSGNIQRVKPVRVGVAAGPGTSPYMVGEVWHFFEQQFNYPITLLRKEDISENTLRDIDVLILPDGSYSEEENILFEWIENGGKAIAMGSVLEIFAMSDKFKLTSQEAPIPADTLTLSNYALKDRKEVSKDIPGAIFLANMDNTHPLAYGYSSQYATLSIGTDSYVLPYGDQVALLSANPVLLNGFAGSIALEKVKGRMVFGVENYGRGKVVYLSDNPLFRSFWENGKLLVINAVLLVD